MLLRHMKAQDFKGWPTDRFDSCNTLGVILLHYALALHEHSIINSYHEHCILFVKFKWMKQSFLN
jgi:hypothetical protein